MNRCCVIVIIDKLDFPSWCTCWRYFSIKVFRCVVFFDFFKTPHLIDDYWDKVPVAGRRNYSLAESTSWEYARNGFLMVCHPPNLKIIAGRLEKYSLHVTLRYFFVSLLLHWKVVIYEVKKCSLLRHRLTKLSRSLVITEGSPMFPLHCVLNVTITEPRIVFSPHFRRLSIKARNSGARKC